MDNERLYREEVRTLLRARMSNSGLSPPLSAQWKGEILVEFPFPCLRCAAIDLYGKSSVVGQFRCFARPARQRRGARTHACSVHTCVNALNLPASGVRKSANTARMGACATSSN